MAWHVIVVFIIILKGLFFHIFISFQDAQTICRRRRNRKSKPPKKRSCPNSHVESADNPDPLALNKRKRKTPDDNEKTSSQPKNNCLTDPSDEDIGFEDSDVFEMMEVFLLLLLTILPRNSRRLSNPFTER